jgi:hypothetical protein
MKGGKKKLQDNIFVGDEIKKKVKKEKPIIEKEIKPVI